ncbi:MAG: septation regulator SpoVG [Spirochaetota bacterium]
MQITDIRIRNVAAEGKLRAYVTVTFDDCFVVHNVKVIEGKSGIFIAMPSRKTKTGEYKDVAHPIHSDFRTELQDRILSAYFASAETESGQTEAAPAETESAYGSVPGTPESDAGELVEEQSV